MQKRMDNPRLTIKFVEEWLIMFEYLFWSFGIITLIDDSDQYPRKTIPCQFGIHKKNNGTCINCLKKIKD